MQSPAKSQVTLKPGSSEPEPGSSILARDIKNVNRKPLVRPVFILAYYYLLGLIGLVLLVGFSLANPQSLADLVKPATFFTLLGLSAAASICNFFPFRLPPGLFLALSMLLYITSFLIFPPVLAAIPPIAGSIVFEVFVAKRGLTYAIRTSGMYVISATIARLVFEATGGGLIKDDFTPNILVPVLAGFVTFRVLNELILVFHLILNGYKLKDSLEHLPVVTGIYLLFLPASTLIAMLYFGIGSVAFTMGCIMVIVVSIIINRAFAAREKESQQLSLVRQLNEELAQQNERQRQLGLRINHTLGSFLPLVQYYTRTSYDQESAVTEIATTIEELSRTATQIAGSADNVATAADQAREAADSGQQAVIATIEAISEVRLKVQEIADKIAELGDKSERISEIVMVINGIAGEIRLLALNATIEASGAGQFGRRFSVVANEVNQLADRSRVALQQIKEIIAEIQAAALSSRVATAEGLSRMEHSADMAVLSEKANQDIISVVEHTAQAAAAISLATQQQRSASEQVVASVHHVASRITQNADKINSLSHASAELENVANELQTERPNLVVKAKN